MSLVWAVNPNFPTLQALGTPVFTGDPANPAHIPELELRLAFFREEFYQPLIDFIASSFHESSNFPLDSSYFLRYIVNYYSQYICTLC